MDTTLANCQGPPLKRADQSASPPPVTPLELVRRGQPLLGTFVFITAYAPSSAHANDAISAAFDEIRRIDGLMSLHRSDSAYPLYFDTLGRPNHLARKEVAALSGG